MNCGSINAILEAIRSGAVVAKVLVQETRTDKKTAQLLALCAQRKIPVQYVPAQVLNRKAGPDHQGVFAEIAPVRFYSPEEILSAGKAGLLLILDGVTDVGNMGAVIRSAVAAGVDGVIVPLHNSAPVNETVLKTSAGALMKVRIHQAHNLVQMVEALKKQGFWIAGADMAGTTNYYDYDFSYKTAIIMGSEDRGISHLLKRHCDHLIRIPHSPEVESLNISAAAAVLLFEAARKKGLFPAGTTVAGAGS